VTAPPADDDLAVLAEVQGVLIEVLEAPNADLAGHVAEMSERGVPVVAWKYRLAETAPSVPSQSR
jgi:hypothetical protein